MSFEVGILLIVTLFLLFYLFFALLRPEKF
jgi:K+-transporting ATPase KdpF subunit